MQTRLLAFLEDTERAIRTERSEPSPGATWEMSRSVNYSLGLARLMLAAREPSGATHPIGGLLLKSFVLADGTLCLKVAMSWHDSTADVAHPIFSKPDLVWAFEAERLASSWLAGPPSPVAALVEEPAMLAAG